METKMYQQITIIGNLGKDVEVRYSQSGMAIANMSIAVSEKVKDGDEWKEHTEWFRVVTFGKTAENCGQYLSKGKKVLVVGRIRQKTYEDKDGVEKRSTELLADQVKFLSPKSEGDEPKASRPATSKPSAAKPKPSASVAPDDGGGFVDDDLPFDLFERGMS